jgi:hypothetical protein
MTAKKVNYRDLVTTATDLLTYNSYQLGYPYKGTRKEHSLAESLAAQVGESFLRPAFYRHYYGTAVYSRIPGDSPVIAAAKAVKRGSWGFDASTVEQVKAAVLAAKVPRWLNALREARTKQNACSAYCDCPACRHKRSSWVRLQAYKAAKRQLELGFKAVCKGCTLQERLKSYRAQVSCLAPVRRHFTLKSVYGGSRWWLAPSWRQVGVCDRYEHTSTAAVVRQTKPLTKLEQWLNRLGCTETRQEYSETGFRPVLDKTVAAFYGQRESYTWFGNFVRQWREFNGYCNPRTRPGWMPAVKRFCVARLAKLCMAHGWTWGEREGCVYFELPAGQASYHLKSYDLARLRSWLGVELPHYAAPWSGLKNTPDILDATFNDQKYAAILNVVVTPLPLATAIAA